MTISEIYDKYTLPEQLRMHHFRVASVAQIICQNLIAPANIDTHIILTTCLLHDVGNMTKIKMESEEPWMLPQGLIYWQQQKENFMNKYGIDDHEATLEILSELNVDLQVREVFAQMPLQSTEAIAKGDTRLLICKHSDNRANPDGVVTVEQRLSYLQERYEKYRDPETYEKAATAMRSIQSTLQSKVKIDLNDITNESAQEEIESLRIYEI